MLCLWADWNVGNFKLEFKDKDKVNAYEYAIIVSRSVLAKIIIFSAHFPFTFSIQTWVLYFVSFNSKGSYTSISDEWKWIPAFFIM